MDFSAAESLDVLERLIVPRAPGDRKALSALYAKTSAKLFGMVLRILERSDWAEEALQETYIKVWRFASAYSIVRGAPMMWLVNIARNQVLDARRHPEIRQAVLEVQLPEDEYGPEFAIDPEPKPGVLWKYPG